MNTELEALLVVQQDDDVIRGIQARQDALAPRLAALDKIRQRAVSYRVEMVPHPGLQIRDVVSLTTDEHTGLACSVESLRLPYREHGGSAELTVRSLAWVA